MEHHHDGTRPTSMVPRFGATDGEGDLAGNWG
jgi:hypothetical protein